MASTPRERSRVPLVEAADTLQRAIRALGDYAHVSVRPLRGHLALVVEDEQAVARCTPLGAGRYGASFRTHTGRWEPMPFVGDLPYLAHALATALDPYLQRSDFPGRNSGLDH